MRHRPVEKTRLGAIVGTACKQIRKNQNRTEESPPFVLRLEHRAL
jgi:hypothetical protein